MKKLNEWLLSNQENCIIVEKLKCNPSGAVVFIEFLQQKNTCKEIYLSDWESACRASLFEAKR